MCIIYQVTLLTLISLSFVDVHFAWPSFLTDYFVVYALITVLVLSVSQVPPLSVG